MSFSSKTKKDLSKIDNLAKKDQVERELIGYLIGNNTIKYRNNIKFSTENEYNINRFGKLLKNCNIEDYNIEIKGKIFTIEYKIKKEFDEIYYDKGKIFFKKLKNDENLDKSLIRGVFLGSGYISNPEKKYHLEINFSEKENLNNICELLFRYNISTKKMKKENSYSLYIKEGEEISKFLAFIGANSSVLKFEENRVIRETRNNVNRLINCETANFTKTIKAGNKQIEDINFIKSKKKFGELPENLKIVANIRLKHPDASLTELVDLLGNTISKSGVSHRLSAISKFADELRK